MCACVCIPVVKSCPRSIYLSKYKSKVQWSIHEVYTNDNIIICTLAYIYNEMIPSNMKREERFNKQRFVHEYSEVHMYAGMYAEADTFKISN